MSRSELEQLVSSAETDPVLQSVLQRCRSRRQLIEVTRRHGYRVTHSDVQRAWLEGPQQQARADGTPAGAAGACPVNFRGITRQQKADVAAVAA